MLELIPVVALRSLKASVLFSPPEKTRLWGLLQELGTRAGKRQKLHQAGRTALSSSLMVWGVGVGWSVLLVREALLDWVFGAGLMDLPDLRW